MGRLLSKEQQKDFVIFKYKPRRISIGNMIKSPTGTV